MGNKKKEEKITFIDLCGVRGCCPQVAVYREEDKVVLTDDYGGQVTLTKAQWRDALIRAKID